MKSKTKIASLLFAGTIFFVACNNNGSSTSSNDSTTAGGDSTTMNNNMSGSDTMNRNNNMSANANNNTSNKDENFVQDVIQSNAKEIAWLNAGIAKGTDKQLKSDAKMMLADHKKMDGELRAYATKKNISMPNIDTSDVANKNDKSGKDWDKDWADKMVDEHQKLVDKFQDKNNKLEDEELKGMVAKNLPTIVKHLEKAKQLQTKLK
jgi:putative membrane protein